MAELTPMMQKYMETKEQYKDCILFYRLGDFYEMFFDDAIVASKELEIALTGKSCGLEERAPMCGIPYHAVETYLARLVSRGYKVAICEQVEDPKVRCRGTGKGTGEERGYPCGDPGDQPGCPVIGSQQEQLPDVHCLYLGWNRHFRSGCHYRRLLCDRGRRPAETEGRTDEI